VYTILCPKFPSARVISSCPNSDSIKSKDGNFAISDVICERTNHVELFLRRWLIEKPKKLYNVFRMQTMK
jgi:hypothetical protein